MTDFYRKHLASDKWLKIRHKRLKHDGFKCRTCWETESLQVHHVTYDNLGDEKNEDLITLCKECHESITAVIRRRRYAKINIRPKRAKGIKNNHVSIQRLSSSVKFSNALTQRPIGKPPKSYRERDEKD